MCLPGLGKRRRGWKWLLQGGGLLTLALLLTGCVEKVDWDVVQWQSTTPAGDIYGSHSVGQSFVPQHNGLTAVELLLLAYSGNDRPAVPLELRLCRDPACQEVVASSTIPADAIAHNASFTFRFPPEQASAGKTYLLQVTAPQATAAARATLWAHTADLYPGGTLFRDGQPVPGDLTFRTCYTLGPGTIAGELLHRAWNGLGHLPGLLGLLLAPGYLLARLLPRSQEDDPLDLLGASLGLSVAAVPVLLLLLSQTPLRWSGPAVRLGGGMLGGLALGLLVWDLARGRWRVRWRSFLPVLLAMAGVIAVSLTLRALHVFDLTGPLWVDAVHHTLLARLIVERGAIPADYRPYMEVAPATYHFGFQSLVAILHQLTGMPLPGALLWLGQVLSGLAGLPLYTLGKRFGKSCWAGVGAATLPSVLTWMPAYFVSWSRYTELAGLFILPVAALLFDRLIRRQRWHWGTALGTTVAMAGLLVTHLRVAAFAGVLALLLLLRTTVQRRYGAWTMLSPWARALGVSLAAAGLCLPWLWPSIQHLWIPAARQWPAAMDSLSLQYVLLGPGRYIAPLAGAGVVLGLFWRKREALLLLLWCGFLVLLANPRFAGLRIGGVVDNLSVAVALYVPASLGFALACGALSGLARKMPGALRPWLRWAGTVLFLALSGWGAAGLRQVVNPRTALLASADVEAMAWIEQHTAPDALFLINSYEWMSSVYAGTDGGYWIAPLTGRRTWPPAALYGLGRPETIAEVNRVAREAMASSDGEALHQLLRQHGIDYVYLGRYGGPLTPEKLASRPHFRPVYQQGGVWIFEVEP